jgi:hypothetical protein
MSPETAVRAAAARRLRAVSLDALGSSSRLSGHRSSSAGDRLATRGGFKNKFGVLVVWGLLSVNSVTVECANRGPTNDIRAALEVRVTASPSVGASSSLAPKTPRGASAPDLSPRTSRTTRHFEPAQSFLRSFICTSLDQWFANAFTHVDR